MLTSIVQIGSQWQPCLLAPSGQGRYTIAELFGQPGPKAEARARAHTRALNKGICFDPTIYVRRIH